jgi:hypothetical protein
MLNKTDMKPTAIIILLLITVLLSGSRQVSNPQIYILPVKNSIKMGMMTGNVNLTLGVKNILSEAIQEKNYDEVMNPDSAEYTLQADLVYFDILKTSSNISVFHKDETETVIRIKGTLFKKGKKVKEIVVEESSNEISTSTLAVNYDGSFNQQSARQAIKKACIKLTNNIL